MPKPSAPFNIQKAMLIGLSVIQLKIVPAKTGVSAAVGGVCTLNAHGFSADLPVVYVSGTGFTGLTAGTTYYVKAPDANTFKLAATPGGADINITAVGSAGVFQPVLVFEVPLLEDEPEQELKPLPRPGFDGVVRNAAAPITKRIERWSFMLDEAKRLPDLFSGALSGLTTGLCTMWVPDYRDTGTTVALKSEADFPVTITRDGKVSFGQEWSKATIKIESNKSTNVAWSVDAVA
jgi:hypothetical protein